MFCKCLIILLTVLSISCQLPLYNWSLPVEINSAKEALEYVSDYNYEPKTGVFLPEEFYYKKYGDCEDFALMLVFILETKLDQKAYLVGGYYNNSSNLHMWVESDGVIYEPTAGAINNNPDLYEELYRYEYNGAIRMVKQYGGFIN